MVSPPELERPRLAVDQMAAPHPPATWRAAEPIGLHATPHRTLSANPAFRLSISPVDRQGAPATTAEDHRARHGFEREPDLWRAGRQRLQRPLRLSLLA